MSVSCRYGCLLPDDQWEAAGYHWRKMTEQDCINRAKRIYKEMHPNQPVEWLRQTFQPPPGYDHYVGKDLAVEECPVAKRKRTSKQALKAHGADLFEPL
jgi:hypothetical protein